jgi:cell wall-associated NlpC family hydrolase
MYRFWLKIVKFSLLCGVSPVLLYTALANAESIDPGRAISIFNILDSRKALTAQPRKTPKSLHKNLAIIIYQTAKPYIGRVPYAWGGTSIRTGMDCSAFSRFIMAKFNIALPRTAKTQAKEGSRVPMKELRPGDLIFFNASNHRPGIDHVGIYIGRDYFVHSCATKGVTLDKLRKYEHRVVTARRVL